MTMTREQAISNYVSQLNSEDLVMLINHMNSYDGCFEDQQWYDMDEFNEFLSNHTLYEIAQMIFYGDDFNPNHDFFRVNAYGNLESDDWYGVKAEAEDLVDDVIEHLVNYYSGDTPWPDLDELVDADDDALFDENFEEVVEEEDQ